MGDPLEGLSESGTIRTGVDITNVAADFRPVRTIMRSRRSSRSRSVTNGGRSTCTAAVGAHAGKSVWLEEYARGQVGQEELHVIEMNKLLCYCSIA